MSLQGNLSVIDTVYGEAEGKGLGEDNFTRNTIDDVRYFGVFDGCGGLGARRYEAVSNHTGAWIASRIAACAVDSFAANEKFTFEENTAELLANKISIFLKTAKEKLSNNTGIQVGGSLSKSMPTTACIAAVKVNTTENGTEKLRCDFFWAGDSRAYILDQNGLCQITKDDIDSNADDAFENLREDGRLTNVANADDKFNLHSISANLKMPKIIICSTDGGFGYLDSPMEFEYLLLNTMQESNTPDEWNKILNDVLHEIAGDDYTLIIETFGFKDFITMKNYFYNRICQLKSEYLPSSDEPSEDELKALWQKYKIEYNKYIR